MKKFLSFLPLVFLSAPLLAEEGAPAARQGTFWQTLIMIGIAIVFFYFILWRPEQKRRKAIESKRSSLKKGDKVTAMGIVGTVLRVQEKTVILAMVDGAKVEMLKGAISEVQPAGEAAQEPEVETAK